jgi:hypothetical protein
MAAFEDIATLQFQSHLPSGQAVRNSFHFRRNPSAGDVDATWLAAWLADANTTTLITAYRALLKPASRLDGLLGRATQDPLNPGDERDEAYRSIDLAGTGTAPAQYTPDELTVITKLNGDLAGRRFRGRVWLPPVHNQTEVLGENVSQVAAYWTAVVAFMAELTKTTYPSGGSHYGGAWNDCDMVVFSRKGRAVDDTYYARVSGIGTGAKLHWLRSRNPSSG